MKRRIKKSQKVVKGMPSAVALSILIHAALFFLAGLLVVFTVVKKEEKKFVPPKAVERPKMKLRKPKVKVKKSAKPKPTTRIVTKVRRASMPDIQLPEMSGMTADLAGGIGGFDMMPDLGEVGIFGSGQTIGNDFEGTFYDFLRDRRGRRITSSESLPEFFREFVADGWDESNFSRHYRSPQKLYATTCMFPCIQSIMARVAYNEFEEGHGPNDFYWAILYKGQLVHKEAITFRFWGMGSSFLIVRVDGETVLDAPLDFRGGIAYLDPTWHSTSAESQKYRIGNGFLTVGDWVTLEPGNPQEMEYLFSDWGGGEFSANLLVEVEGVEYPKNRQGGPILPIFKTAEQSFDQLDHIMEFMVYDSACLTNGPVFCDYDPVSGTPGISTTPADPAPVLQPQISEAPEDGIRTWTLADGRKIDARLKTTVMGNVVLENTRGKQKKIPLSSFSEGDRKFAELSTPPEFNINFSKTSAMRTVPPSNLSNWQQPKLFDYTFGVTLKQTSTGDYGYPLHVECFAVGKQINGSDTYVLLDRIEATFTPSPENKRSLALRGDPVLLFDHVLYEVHMGKRPVSYLIVVTDERGEIIQHATPNKWIFEHLENLRKMPVGRFMDKTCTRVHPERPDIGARWNYDLR